MSFFKETHNRIRHTFNLIHVKVVFYYSFIFLCIYYGPTQLEIICNFHISYYCVYAYILLEIRMAICLQYKCCIEADNIGHFFMRCIKEDVVEKRQIFNWYWRKNRFFRKIFKSIFKTHLRLWVLAHVREKIIEKKA